MCWFQWYYNFYNINWNSEKNWGNIYKTFIIIFNGNLAFSKNLFVDGKSNKITRKQSTQLKSTTKIYYINGALEWFRCNQHFKTKEKDCISHELLIAKMDGHGFSESALTFFFPNWNDENKAFKLITHYSIFQLLLSGVPKSSILGSIFFNLFINDLCMYIKNSDLHNFADDYNFLRFKFAKWTNHFVIFSPWKVQWNWIAFSQNSFVILPGLLYHLIRRDTGQLASEDFTSNPIVFLRQ